MSSTAGRSSALDAATFYLPAAQGGLEDFFPLHFQTQKSGCDLSAFMKKIRAVRFVQRSSGARLAIKSTDRGIEKLSSSGETTQSGERRTFFRCPRRNEYFFLNQRAF